MSDRADGPRQANARARKRVFLDAFRQSGNVSEAARVAGVARQRPYAWAGEDPEFRAAWDEAEQEAIDLLEKVALDLATGALEKPVVSAGKLVTTERIYSERMIEMLLKARRPDVYTTRQQIEHSGEVKTLQQLLSEVPRGE